jgi:ribosome-associated protein
MSNEFINKEIDEIMKEKAFDFPQNTAMSSAWVLGNLKGTNLKVLKMSQDFSLTDFFVIGSAQNPVQSKAMADEICFQLKRHNCEVRSKESDQNAEWILLDFGDIIVHIFVEHARSTYDLESLWSNSTEIEIPQEYYFERGNDSEKSTEKSQKDYF